MCNFWINGFDVVQEIYIHLIVFCGQIDAICDRDFNEMKN